MLAESLELVFEILLLLPGKPRCSVVSVEPLEMLAMAFPAISHFFFNVARVNHGWHEDRQDRRLHHHSQSAGFHVLTFPRPLRFLLRRDLAEVFRRLFLS